MFWLLLEDSGTRQQNDEVKWSRLSNTLRKERMSDPQGAREGSFGKRREEKERPYRELEGWSERGKKEKGKVLATKRTMMVLESRWEESGVVR